METCRSEVIEQLCVDEVDLAHVGLRWIGRHSGSVLHGGAEMGITLDPKTFMQADGVHRLLAEGVRRTHMDRYNLTTHAPYPASAPTPATEQVGSIFGAYDPTWHGIEPLPQLHDDVHPVRATGDRSRCRWSLSGAPHHPVAATAYSFGHGKAGPAGG
jgi:hypothetical protein